MRKALKDYLNNIEKASSLDITQEGLKLKSLLKANERPVTDESELAELFAFNFFTDNNTDTGSYVYGPQFILPDEDGHMVEFPSRSRVNQDMISYWSSRSSETSNLILRSRYSDLVFDFLDKEQNGKLKSDAAKIVIESNYLIMTEYELEDSDLRTYYSRGLFLISKTRANAYEIKYIELLLEMLSTSQTLSDYAFRELVLHKKRRSKLNPSQLKLIIDSADDYVRKMLKSTGQKPWAVDERAAEITRYYAEMNNEKAAMSLAEAIESSYRKSEYANSNGMIKSNYLVTLRELYSDLAQFADAKKKRDLIAHELTSLSEEIESGLKEHSFEIKISNKQQKQIRDMTLSIYEKNGKALPLQRSISKIVSYYLPRIDKEKISLKDMHQEHPISYLVTKTIVGEDGFNIAQLNGFDEDESKYLIEHYSNNLQFSSLLLRMAYEELRRRFTAEDVQGALEKSPLFREGDRAYFKRALDAFWDKDYVVASHLFIPIIEDAFRILHRINGLPTIKPNPDGGFDYYTKLDRYIDHDVVKGVFDVIGKDFQYYARVVLIERIGWNLRNNFAHGINKSSFMRPEPAERLFHILLILSLVRNREDIQSGQQK